LLCNKKKLSEHLPIHLIRLEKMNIKTDRTKVKVSGTAQTE
jgi:hypothetical protein